MDLEAEARAEAERQDRDRFDFTAGAVWAASRREPPVHLPRDRGDGVVIETDDFVPEPSDTDEREALIRLLLDRKFNDPLIEYASTEPDDVALVGEIVDLILGALHRQGQITEAMAKAAFLAFMGMDEQDFAEMTRRYRAASVAQGVAALEAAEEARRS